MANLNKQIQQQTAKMPKYKIQQEAKDTQNLARSRAFGRDRGIQMAEEQMESQAARDAATAQDISDSTSGLLSTIASINANTVSGKTNLGMAEADIQRQNVGDLYAANEGMINEKDKAWYQNVYAPWEAKLRNLQERKARKDQFWSSMAGGLLQGVGALASGGAFEAGGMFGKKS
jgi:hypothetical protein